MIFSMLLGCQTNPLPDLPAVTELPEVADDIEPKDIILILVRGLRADLSSDVASTQVFIEGIGTQPSTHFTSAYTQSTSDFVSTSTIFTGMYPSAIPMCGLIRAGSDQIALKDQPWCAKIPEDRYSLANVLSIYGYRTHLLSLDTHWHSLVETGFQTSTTFNDTPLQDVVESAKIWWQQASDRPRFLTIITDNRLLENSLHSNQAQAREGYLKDAKNIGSALKPLFEITQGQSNSIYITSLNGISLMEQDGFDDEPVPDGESDVLTERTLHVPILFYSGTEPQKNDVIVENIDIFPSIIDEIGGQSPANVLGEPFRKSQDDPHAYAEFGDMFALRRAEHLLVFRGFLHDHTSLDPDLTDRLKDYRAPLFTLSKVGSDPYQKTNLRDQEFGLFQQFYKELILIREGRAAPPVSTFSPKQLWDLRMTPAQGYW